MTPVTERPAFEVDGEPVVWARVVEEARRSGAWETVETTARQGVACLAADAAAGRAPRGADVREAAARWRTARGLTAAEDMEALLERWDLDVPLFYDHIRRTLARQGHQEDDAALAASHHPFDDEEELERKVWATAVFSGALQRAAHDLAGRLAVRARLVEEGRAGPEDDLDVVTEHFRRLVVTPETIREELDTRQLDWIRIDGDLLVFPSQDAAREARLCLEDDGATVAELAAMTGTDVHRQRQYVEDAPEEHRPTLLAAQAGDVVGPLARKGVWELLAIAGRRPPSLDDADIHRRAEDAVWSRAVDHEVDERVSWSVRP